MSSSSIFQLLLIYTVPHKKLCLKLDHIGIHGNVLRWNVSFLTNCQQRACVDGCPSQWSSVLSGLPQESILGLLLFLICVNDISDNWIHQLRCLLMTVSCWERSSADRANSRMILPESTTGLKFSNFIWTFSSANYSVYLSKSFHHQTFKSFVTTLLNILWVVPKLATCRLYHSNLDNSWVKW